MRQHQKVIDLEEKSGVKKDYLPVGLSLAEHSLNAAINQKGGRASINQTLSGSPVLS